MDKAKFIEWCNANKKNEPLNDEYATGDFDYIDWEDLIEYLKNEKDSESSKEDFPLIEDDVTICKNCGAFNIDDGHHKFDMERCRCRHYLFQ